MCFKEELRAFTSEIKDEVEDRLLFVMSRSEKFMNPDVGYTTYLKEISMM